MVYFKNLLIAFDGSKDGMQALEVAHRFAANSDAHLTVVYVHGDPLDYTVSLGTTPDGESYLFRPQTYMAPSSVASDMPPIPGDQENLVVEDDIPLHVMDQAKRKLGSTEVQVTYEKLTGKPATEISNYANENNIDVIIIGNRGVSGIKKLVQGSVSQKVTSEAECSVLVVK